MLSRGDQFGNYEIIEPIGAGGVGEVFRAHDARLGRDVAIKVLSARFPLDAQRQLRFEREARILAALNHPNIATLHAVETLGDTQALVLELVEGETLAARIARGALPLAEAMGIARQVAAGLAAAHEHGVVHRDLKPSNVKLRPDGTVKLLDFGLAKITEVQPSGADPAGVTVTMAGAAGTVMGTPAYMSPEQVRGLPGDRRTDIWAFGCLLYQMLTGDPPFRAEHAPDVLAKIIEREPDCTLLPAATPRAVRNLLSRCLRKDPHERLRDIADARLYLEESGLGEQGAESGTRWRWLVAAVAALAGLAVAAAWLLRDRVQPAQQQAGHSVVRYSMPVQLANQWGGQTFAISPDGSRFAWTSSHGLTVRARDALESIEVPVPGKTYVMAPFFSPDGRSIGYFDGGVDLVSVPVQGGPAVELAQAGPAATAHWSEAGIVVASMDGVFRIPAGGGNAEPVKASIGRTEQAVFPQMLPGGRALLFTLLPTRSNTIQGVSDGANVRVEVLDLASGEQRTLVRGGGHALYVPTGHLLYVTGTALNAVAFDAASLQVRGRPVTVVTGVRNAEYAVAGDGTLVYRSGGAPGASTLVWVDRQGREQPIDAPPRRYHYARLSPDGRRVALDLQDAAGIRDMYIWDMDRRRLDPVADDSSGKVLMAWSPDGRALAYGTARYGVTTTVLQSLGGGAEPRRLVENQHLTIPIAFAPDGRLLVSADVPGRGRDILALAVDGSGREEPIVHGAGNDLNADVSPDGRWIVYESDDSGQYELYVRPYPDAYASSSLRITAGGGRHPVWSHDGREIFHCTYDADLWALPVKPGPQFEHGPAVRVIGDAQARGYRCGGRTTSGRAYDVTPDGQRFLMIKSGEASFGGGEDGLVVVLNFFEELNKAVAGETALLPVPATW